MSQLQYDVIISGDLVGDFTSEQVQKNLSKLFDFTFRRAAQLTSQKDYVYGRGLSYEQADGLITQFKQAGMDAYLIRHIPE